MPSWIELVPYDTILVHDVRISTKFHVRKDRYSDIERTLDITDTLFDSKKSCNLKLSTGDLI